MFNSEFWSVWTQACQWSPQDRSRDPNTGLWLDKTHHEDPDNGADGLILLDESVELSDPGTVVVQNLFTREF